jgi:hypothetical protein
MTGSADMVRVEDKRRKKGGEREGKSLNVSLLGTEISSQESRLPTAPKERKRRVDVFSAKWRNADVISSIK